MLAPIELFAGIVPAAVVGGFAQRVSGVGAALIAAPALTLISGPKTGVVLTNVLSVVVALAVFATSARHVDRAKAALMVPAGLVGVVPGTVLFRLLPPGPLQVTVGAITGLGLLAVLVAPRLRVAPRPALTAGTGLVSGFTTAAAGAGGPAIAVYAVATGWPQEQFAATGQLNYATQAAAALAVKPLPPLPLLWLGAAVAAALCGLVAGHLLAPRIATGHARRAALTLAAIAALLTVVNGLRS